MRRRKLLAGIGATGAAAIAGCGCIGKQWPAVSYAVEPQSIGRSGEELVTESRVNVEFSFGDDGEVVETVQV